jgi:hypothetical protein
MYLREKSERPFLHKCKSTWINRALGVPALAPVRFQARPTAVEIGEDGQLAHGGLTGAEGEGGSVVGVE